MKILLIQLGGAAEVLLSTPLVRCLKKQLTGAELHILLQHPQEEILSNNSFIEKCHLLHFNLKTTAEELKLQNFDRLIDLSQNETSRHISSALHISEQTHQKGIKTFWKRLFRPQSKKHTALQYLQKASGFGITYDGAGFDYVIPRSAVVPFSDIPASHHAGFSAIAVSAAEDRPWPVTFLQQLVSAIQHPIILIGNAEDRAPAEKLKALDDVKIYNACGKFSVHETSDLIHKSKLLVASHPFYVQTAAAMEREMIWLQAPGSPKPFYSNAFLKSRKTVPFDSITVPSSLFNNKKEDTAFEKAVAGFASQVVAAVQQRLKSRG